MVIRIIVFLICETNQPVNMGLLDFMQKCLRGKLDSDTAFGGASAAVEDVSVVSKDLG